MNITKIILTAIALIFMVSCGDQLAELTLTRMNQAQEEMVRRFLLRLPDIMD